MDGFWASVIVAFFSARCSSLIERRLAGKIGSEIWRFVVAVILAIAIGLFIAVIFRLLATVPQP